MSSKLNQALAEAEAIQAAEPTADSLDVPLPAHVKVGQPGRARSKVLQVRLNPEEMTALECIAERRELPVSAVARAGLLRLIAEENASTDRLGQLIEAANQVRSLAHDVRKDLHDRASQTREALALADADRHSDDMDFVEAITDPVDDE